MRISPAQRAENENRVRAAMNRPLRGEIPPGGNAAPPHEAEVGRTAFCGARPCAHLGA